MKTSISSEIFPSDIWATILAFTIETKKEYGVISRTSKQISEVAQKHLFLFNHEIALAFVVAHPKKFTQLPALLKEDPKFIIETLSKIALPWSQVIHLHNHKEWPHIIQCTVAAASFLNPKVLKKPPRLILKSDHAKLIPITRERLKRRKEKKETPTDISQYSEIEVRKIPQRTLRQYAHQGWGTTNKAFMMRLFKLPYSWPVEELSAINHLKNTTPELKANRELVLQAVQLNGLALEFADPLLQDDKEVALKAIHSCPHALQFVSTAIKMNQDVIIAAVRRSTELDWSIDFLEYVDSTLFSNTLFTTQLLQINGEVYNYLSPDLQEQRAYILLALQNSPNFNLTLKICRRYPADKELILAGIHRYPHLITELSDDMQRDKEIIIAALQQNPKLIRNIIKKIKNDISLITQLVSSNATIYSLPSFERASLCLKQ